MTNTLGIFAAGECDYSQHGGNRLGANSLLSAIYGGDVAGVSSIKYIEGLEMHVEDMPTKLFDDHVKEEQDKFEALMKMDGAENAYQIHQDRKSTRLNSSHVDTSYVVFCLKKKTK